MALQSFDLAVIGGGLAGCAVARDAAGRGLSVFLCDLGDIANGATSNGARMTLDGIVSTGGFSLLASHRARVEESRLVRNAPHLVQPIRFVMPGQSARGRLRRAALAAHGRIRADRKLVSPPRTMRLVEDTAGKVLKDGFRRAREFSAFLADETRLAVLNALDARARGAEIRSRTRCLEAHREGWFWRITLESVETGHRWKVVARTLVNAAGGHAAGMLGDVIRDAARPQLSLVRSSYIIVGRGLGEGRGYVVTAGDGRLVFAVPLGPDFTLVGPSEAGHAGDPGVAAASMADIDYLTEAANYWFREPVGADDIAWTSAGVRAVRTGRRRSFAGEVERDVPEDIAPLVSLFDVSTVGHRMVAEEAVDAFAGHVAMEPRWTADAPLPGGHTAVEAMPDLVRAMRAAYPFLAPADAERMVAAYGTRAATILTGARRAEDLGHRFGAGLSEAEVRYLMNEEWARTASDILWRRSSLGLRMSAADAATLDLWMARARQPLAAPAA